MRGQIDVADAERRVCPWYENEMVTVLSRAFGGSGAPMRQGVCGDTGNERLRARKNSVDSI
jgi:hypothetical protein